MRSLRVLTGILVCVCVCVCVCVWRGVCVFVYEYIILIDQQNINLQDVTQLVVEMINN